MSGDESVLEQKQPSPDPPEGPKEVPSSTEDEGLDLGSVSFEGVIRPIAIAGMLTCIAISLSQVLNTFSSGWPGRFFVALTFLVSLESIHAQRLLARAAHSREDRLRFRFVEWVVILLVVRFGVYTEYGMDRLITDMSAWSVQIGSFFNIAFILTSFLILAFWAVALMLSRTMQELEASPLERMPSITDPNYYLRSTMPRHGRVNRQARLNRITAVFFWGGVMLLILTGVARTDVQDLIMFQHSRSSGIILNVLAYFLIGFLIISQAQYTILKANWELQGIPILEGLGRRWAWLVLAFLLLIGIVAALLPVSYSVGVLDALYSAVSWIMYILVRAGFLILFIVSYLLGLLMSLFTGHGDSPPLESPRISPIAPPQPALVDSGPNPWWQLARSLIFWTVLLSVVAYSLFHFMRDRWGLFQGALTRRFFAWLAGLWRGLRRGTRRAVVGLGRQIAARLARRQPRESVSRWRYLSLRRLSPRERVRYFYLSILHRTSRQGFGRPSWMTPLEYESRLAQELPGITEEVGSLSQAFVEARYSEHDITRDESSRVKEVWRRVKRALTMRRRGRSTQTQATPVSETDPGP